VVVRPPGIAKGNSSAPGDTKSSGWQEALCESVICYSDIGLGSTRDEKLVVIRFCHIPWQTRWHDPSTHLSYTRLEAYMVIWPRSMHVLGLSRSLCSVKLINFKGGLIMKQIITKSRRNARVRMVRPGIVYVIPCISVKSVVRYGICLTTASIHIPSLTSSTRSNIFKPRSLPLHHLSA
jgi:hypothetical protein